jgi:hypothetical protein
MALKLSDYKYTLDNQTKKNNSSKLKLSDYNYVLNTPEKEKSNINPFIQGAVGITGGIATGLSKGAEFLTGGGLRAVEGLFGIEAERSGIEKLLYDKRMALQESIDDIVTNKTIKTGSDITSGITEFVVGGKAGSGIKGGRAVSYGLQGAAQGNDAANASNTTGLKKSANILTQGALGATNAIDFGLVSKVWKSKGAKEIAKNMVKDLVFNAGQGVVQRGTTEFTNQKLLGLEANKNIGRDIVNGIGLDTATNLIMGYGGKSLDIVKNNIKNGTAKDTEIMKAMEVIADDKSLPIDQKKLITKAMVEARKTVNSQPSVDKLILDGVDKNVNDLPIEKQILDGMSNAPKIPKTFKVTNAKKPMSLIEAKDILGNTSNFRKKVNEFRTQIVNKNTALDDLSKRTGNKNIKYYADELGTTNAKAQYAIGRKQTDNMGKNIGKSVKEIFEPAKKSGKLKEFEYYLQHLLNITRAKQGKPVFGKDITAGLSKKVIRELELKNPEFKQWADDVRNFNNNERNNLVQSGLSSQEQADYFANLNPDYVRIERDFPQYQNRFVKNKGSVKSPYKTAIGGDKEILSIENSMAKQIIENKKNISRNKLGQELYKEFGGEFHNPKTFDPNTMITIFKDGQKIDVKVGNDIVKSLTPSEVRDYFGSKVIRGIAKFQRAIITDKNPIFIVTNFAKDLQDGLFNSKHPVQFVKNYGVALKMMATNDPIWQQYKALGGEANTFFNFDTGFVGEKGIVGKTVDTVFSPITAANKAIEQAPRFAEFLSTIKKGGSLEEAMYNAAEVTINFKRGGELAKAASRNGFNFFNASIQGFDKLVRNVSGQNGTKGVIEGIGGTVLKATMLSIIPSIVNDAIWANDKDYQNMTDRDKNAYWVVGKLDNGKFIKIPKGRALSVFGAAANSVLNNEKGDKLNLGEVVGFAADQVAPINPLKNNIASPILGLGTNKNFFGGDIVPQRLQDELPKNQYDENSTEIAKSIGKLFNLSPKKIDYIAEQYSGGIGKLAKPLFTKKKEKNPLVTPFISDTVNNGQIANDFYKKQKRLLGKSKDSKATASDISNYKYINSIGYTVNDLYNLKREVENLDISASEKEKRRTNIQRQINEIMDYALKNIK